MDITDAEIIEEITDESETLPVLANETESNSSENGYRENLNNRIAAIVNTADNVYVGGKKMFDTVKDFVMQKIVHNETFKKNVRGFLQNIQKNVVSTARSIGKFVDELAQETARAELENRSNVRLLPVQSQSNSQRALPAPVREIAVQSYMMKSRD